MAAAAKDLSSIGSTISAANAAATASTTDVLPAAADEVSTAVAALFGSYGRNYQSLGAQAAAFHEDFVNTLNAASDSYAQTEAANASAVTAPGPAASVNLSVGNGVLGKLSTISNNIYLAGQILKYRWHREPPEQTPAILQRLLDALSGGA
jgi:hypothetical protein